MNACEFWQYFTFAKKISAKYPFFFDLPKLIPAKISALKVSRRGNYLKTVHM